MAELDTEDRRKLRPSQFAYVDSKGGEHLPINDASHVRNAIARFGQTDFEGSGARKRAARRILAAAAKHGIDVAEDSSVHRSSKR